MFSVVRLGLVAISVAGNAIAQPLEVFRDCDVCPEMIELPMGAFMMGTKPNEIRVAWLKNLDFAQTYRKDSEFFSKSDETPRHRVDVNIPIAMGRNEVTYDEWIACVQDGGCNGYVPPDRMAIRSGDWIGGNHPVTRVSFHDAQAYTEWLNLKLGTNTYRLPTEAEWEYAGRAGTETRFAQGDEITTDRVNFSGEATEYYTFVERPWLETRRVPVPVDELDAANAWGLRHMSGNVEEVDQLLLHQALCRLGQHEPLAGGEPPGVQ